LTFYRHASKIDWCAVWHNISRYETGPSMKGNLLPEAARVKA